VNDKVRFSWSTEQIMA